MIPAYPWSKDDAQIIKAAWANEHGRKALDLIVARLCNLHGLSMSGDPHTTAFQEGRRFVGVSLAAAINTPLDKLVRTDDDHRSSGITTATERAAGVAAGKYAGTSTGGARGRKPAGQ